MPKPYSNDLRERVVSAVVEQGLSRHQAAARFGVAPSTAINWVRKFRETGDVSPYQMGGYKPRKIRDGHAAWLTDRIRARDFTLRELVAELAERGLVVDGRLVWDFVRAEGLTFKKRRWSPASRAAPTSSGDASSG
jgi:putative transposase